MGTPREDAPRREAGGSLVDLAVGLLNELPGLVSDRVRLLALELQGASIAVARLLAVAVVGGVLLGTAWVAFWVGVAAGLIDAGVAWHWVALIVVAVNLAGAAVLLQVARALLRKVTLPATVRRLTSTPIVPGGVQRQSAPEAAP